MPRLGKTRLGEYRLGNEVLLRDITSHTGSVTSTSSRVVDLFESVTSHCGVVTSTTSKTQTYSRGTTSHSTPVTSSAICVIDISESVTSHSEPIESWTYNNRTSLEVVDFDVQWDEDESVWYTDWFQLEKILGTEDQLSIISDVVPHAKEPCATIHVEYDSDGNQSNVIRSDPVEVGQDEDAHVVTGVPLEQDSWYRLRISNYSGYNSIYTLNIGFTH